MTVSKEFGDRVAVGFAMAEGSPLIVLGFTIASGWIDSL